MSIGTVQYGGLSVTPGAEEVLAASMTIIRPTGEILASLTRKERSSVAILPVSC